MFKTRRHRLVASLAIVALAVAVVIVRHHRSLRAHPKFTRGFQGVWVIDVERSVREINSIPDGIYAPRFPTMNAFRTYVREQIADAQFEIHPDNTAYFRRKGRIVYHMTWNGIGNRFWVGMETGEAPFGHIFIVDNDHEAICKFEVDYSDAVAPRCPLYVTKIWEYPADSARGR